MAAVSDFNRPVRVGIEETLSCPDCSVSHYYVVSVADLDEAREIPILTKLTETETYFDPKMSREDAETKAVVMRVCMHSSRESSSRRQFNRCRFRLRFVS
jgi:hypothetical protein